MSITTQAAAAGPALQRDETAQGGVPSGWKTPVAIAAGVTGLATFAALVLSDLTPSEAGVLVLACWGFTGVGLLEWTRQPSNAIGPLLCLFGTTALLSTVVVSMTSIVFTVGYALSALPPLALAHLLLSYPNGVLADRLDRRAVCLAYVIVAPFPLLLLAVYDPADHVYGINGCRLALKECARSALLVWDEPRAYDAAWWLQVGLQCTAAAGLTTLAVRRYRRASQRSRWLFASLLFVGVLVGVRVIVGNVLYVLHEDRSASWGNSAMFWTTVIAQGAVAVVLLQGLYRRRLAHAAVSRLVVDLERSPEGVETALARAVDDATLKVVFWLPERELYVDDRGRAFEPRNAGAGRMLTPVERDGSPLALLVHDRALEEEPGLAEAAAAAAGLALENARLQAEVRARLVEAEQSRARIVQAADEERRRLERDLHDGAQQRLVALALSLRVAEQKLHGQDESDVEGVLGAAVVELQRAVRELRELARGVYPAILTEEGLGAAIASLAGRSAIPVVVRAVPDDRLPPAIEAAAYFVICEAITNAAKHSGAAVVSIDVRHARSRLVVTISDDGCGGARPSPGSGLSGLADRVATHGGTLRVHSPAHAGTTIVAEVRCEP